MNTKNIFQEGCLISCSIRKWSGVKEISSDNIETKDASKDWIKARKRLVPKDFFKEVTKVLNRVNKRIKMYSLPFPIRGIHFVPKRLISRLDAELKADKADLLEVLEETINGRWEEIIEEAREHLGELFDETQYPVDIKSRFDIEWKFFHLDVPDKRLGILSPEQYEEEVKKLRETVKEVQELAVSALRIEMKELVDRAVAKLTDPEAKRFHKSTINNFVEFFNTFEDKNIFDDKDLTEIIEMAKIVVQESDMDKIKNDSSFRQEVAEAFQVVQKEMEKSIIDRPRRKIVGRM